MAKQVKPQDHPLWEAFCEWGDANGVDREHEEDWLNWWKCFLAGATAFASGKG